MIIVNVFKKVAISRSNKWITSVVNLTTKIENKIRGEVEIIIVGDSEIKRLNREYRGKNKTTDVLSFAWQEDGIVRTKILGQVYLCYPQIRRQAKIWRVPAKKEFARMLIHGLLHLVGYDHDNDEDSKKMFSLQEKVVKLV
jgi:probable rRNA maturation factor